MHTNTWYLLNITLQSTLYWEREKKLLITFNAKQKEEK